MISSGRRRLVQAVEDMLDSPEGLLVIDNGGWLVCRWRNLPAESIDHHLTKDVECDQPSSSSRKVHEYVESALVFQEQKKQRYTCSSCLCDLAVVLMMIVVPRGRSVDGGRQHWS
nr:hypothetical protein Iba_scaffold60629CG0010 [Ipomoea batatas]GME01412.1 hypothetical protein Iba_scaffold57439CG0010 [Ipomoea batatas]GME01413.1 hypothetical protein Iba_scaffold57440CG0010 [Ipomoea batatas]GME03269.1 hypothetical protein Iba_scaffold587CG0200 [Ipomoea batatas]